MIAVLGRSSADYVNHTALLYYAEFGMFGALGAFLSVIAGIRSVDIDINLSKWEHVFAGATRILIGMIGAWIVALALNSALIDPTFGNKDADQGTKNIMGFPARTAMYFIFAFIGGFSQTLVPNLLKRGEEAAGAGAKPGAPTGPIVRGPTP